LQIVMDSYLPPALKKRVRLEMLHFHFGVTALIHHTQLAACQNPM